MIDNSSVLVLFSFHFHFAIDGVPKSTFQRSTHTNVGYGTAGAILKNNYNKKAKQHLFNTLEIRVTQFQETEYNNNEKKKNKIRSSRLVIRAGKTLWQKKKKRMWGERGPFSIIQLKRITVFFLQKYGPPGGVGSP